MSNNNPTYSSAPGLLETIKNPLLWITLLCLAYWSYLGYTSRMEVKFDSIDYYNLGKMLESRGFLEYFRTGPHREPLYPLLIAGAIKVSEYVPLPDLKILTIFQLILLGITQILTYVLLKKLKVHRNWAATAALYIGISPALLNAALSVYSEIITFPLVLVFLLCLIKAWEAIERWDGPANTLWSILVGIFAIAILFSKGIFELIIPLFLFLCALRLPLLWKARNAFFNFLTHLLIIIVIFEGAVIGFKSLNQKYNGRYVLTDRGAWALYGATARRVENIPPQRFMAGIFYIPGEGVCQQHFDEEECKFWSAQYSDSIAFTKLQDLDRQGISGKQVNKIFLDLSREEFSKNPTQYLTLYFLEGLKLLFWESTKIGWVIYPQPVANIYDTTVLKNSLRGILAVITILGLGYVIFYILRRQPGIYDISSSDLEGEENKDRFLVPILNFILAYVLAHAFFYILTRYALVLAPLYLTLTAFSLHKIFIKSEVAQQKPSAKTVETQPLPVIEQAKEPEPPPAPERKIYRP